MPGTSFKSKKVLVIGGAGFVGSHLIEKLLEAGSEVTSLDNYSTGKLENEIQGAKRMGRVPRNVVGERTPSLLPKPSHLRVTALRGAANLHK